MMAGRELPLVTGEYYRVYNRGVARQPTFLDDRDYKQAMLSMSYYRSLSPPVKLSRYKNLPKTERDNLLEKLNKSGQGWVQIVSFVLMPNHFHFLLKQLEDGGISKFTGQFSNSYTRYFNTRRSRPGSLFQGTFKAVHVETEEQLLHLSRYIHLNPLVSSVITKSGLVAYPWSSYPDYLQGRSQLVEMSLVMSFFKSPTDYQSFVTNHADYARELEVIKHIAMDLD